MGHLVRNPRQMGNQLRAARRAQGLTQAALGEMAGLRQETISLIESGNPATRLETLLKILACLDLELELRPRTRTGSDIFEELL